MVAFVLSFVIALLALVGAYAYSRRRPVGAPLSWGEAIGAATFAFALMFWSYGVVPHQWLTWAGNELGWTSNKFFVGWKLPFTGEEGIVQYFLPFSVHYENLKDIIAVGIYGIFLAVHIGAWAVWQDRAKAKAAVVPTSGYGRPLVKQG